MLKRNKIKFQAKKRIGKYCVDFAIGKVIIEVDGSVHKETNREKDIYLVSQGYIPLHIRNVFDLKEMEKELTYLIKANRNIKGR